MNANPQFLNTTAHVDEAAVKSLPNSRKVYIEGSRPDIRVPMREISQSDTPLGHGNGKAEKNPPIYVYDTSGPYTDPSVKIDIRSGLNPLRQKWIEERNDTIVLDGPSSGYGKERLADPKLASLRFNLHRKPRVAKPGMNVSQMHYAKKGIVTPAFDRIEIALARRKQRDVADEAVGVCDAVAQRDRGEVTGEAGAGDCPADEREARMRREPIGISLHDLEASHLLVTCQVSHPRQAIYPIREADQRVASNHGNRSH